MKTNHVSSNPDALQLELQVIVSEEDNSVYVKFMGFDTVEEAINAAVIEVNKIG